jgi:carbamoyl-phosphate synthase large subunit
MEATKWRGPCEVEVVKDSKGTCHLLEINPRFPAWSFLSAGAGTNLPWAVARMAAGEAVDPLPPPKVGTMFVRISLDQVTDMADFEQLATSGEINRGARDDDGRSDR